MVGHAVQGLGARVPPMCLRLPPFIIIHWSLTGKDSCKYPDLERAQKKIRPFEKKLDTMSEREHKRVSQR